MAAYSNISLKAVQENLMINSVKCYTQDEENKNWGWASIKGTLEITDRFDKCGFSALKSLKYRMYGFL